MFGRKEAVDPVSRKGNKGRKALATKTEKLYMAIAGAEALIVTAIAWAYFGLVQANVPAQDAKTRTVPVYIAIFIFAHSQIQLILHTFFNLCIFIYAVIQLPQTRDALSGLGPNVRCGAYPRCTGDDSLFNVIYGPLVVVPIVIGIATLGFAVLIRKLYAEFGWADFRLVGASLEMKQMHRAYQTLVSLLKLLFFFATSFCIAFLILVIKASDKTAEFIITIVALPVTPIVILACGWAVRKENKPAMYVSLVLMLAGVAYFIYKLASMFLPEATGLYINTRVTMVLFACFAIIILVATFINGCICLHNFGRGLLQAHQDPANKTSLWSIPDQMSRSAEEGASKYTTDTITGRGYNYGGTAPTSPGVVGKEDEGRLVID